MGKPTSAVARAVRRSKQEIFEDVAAGVVPVDVRSFSELHNYVDANDYGGVNEGDLTIAQSNEVQQRVDRWIKSGAVRRKVASVRSRSIPSIL